MFLGSGSIRQPEIGPIVCYQDICNCFSYDEPITRIFVTGAQLRRMLLWVFRDEAWTGDHTEFYQFSHNLRVHYKKSTHEILDLTVRGEAVDDEKRYSVGFAEYHFINLKDFVNVDLEEVKKNGMCRKVSTGQIDIYTEWMGMRDVVVDPGDTRMFIEE